MCVRGKKATKDEMRTWEIRIMTLLNHVKDPVHPIYFNFVPILCGAHHGLCK